MRTDHPREDPLVELGYEVRDVNYKALTKSIVFFFAFAAFSGGAGLVVYNFMHPLKDRSTAERNASVNRIMPPVGTPLVQDNVLSKTDIMTLRHAEDARLHSTGYADDAKTIAHIPVERAMDLLVERGLPKTNANVSVGDATTRPPTGDQVREFPSSPGNGPTSAAPTTQTAPVTGNTPGAPEHQGAPQH